MGLPRLIEQNKKRHAHQIGKQPECGPKPVMPRRCPPRAFQKPGRTGQAAQIHEQRDVWKGRRFFAAFIPPPLNAGAKVNASIAPCSTTLAATYAAASQTKSYSPYSFDMVYYLSAISSNHFVFRLEYRLARLHGVSKNHFLLPESNLFRAILKTAMQAYKVKKSGLQTRPQPAFRHFSIQAALMPATASPAPARWALRRTFRGRRGLRRGWGAG